MVGTRPPARMIGQTGDQSVLGRRDVWLVVAAGIDDEIKDLCNELFF